LPAETTWSVVALSVICTAIAFVVFFALIKEVGPTRAVVVTYINPAIALLLALLRSANRSHSDGDRLSGDPRRFGARYLVAAARQTGRRCRRASGAPEPAVSELKSRFSPVGVSPASSSDSTCARGGPVRHQSIASSTASEVPSNAASTRPSGRFAT